MNYFSRNFATRFPLLARDNPLFLRRKDFYKNFASFFRRGKIFVAKNFGMDEIVRNGAQDFLSARNGDFFASVGALSGGERAKLALCVLECERGNVLLMDEPTNHLDLPAREGLENALKKFDGTLIFVSHDRYFISALADRIAEISEEKLNYFECDYEGYTLEKKKLAEKRRQAEEAEKYAERETEKAKSYRSKKERAEEERRKQRIKQIESEISKFENEEEEINTLLASPEVSTDYKRVNELLARLEAIKLQVDGLYKEYELMI